MRFGVAQERANKSDELVVDLRHERAVVDTHTDPRLVVSLAESHFDVVGLVGVHGGRVSRRRARSRQSRVFRSRSARSACRHATHTDDRARIGRDRRGRGRCRPSRPACRRRCAGWSAAGRRPASSVRRRALDVAFGAAIVDGVVPGAGGLVRCRRRGATRTVAVVLGRRWVRHLHVCAFARRRRERSTDAEHEHDGRDSGRLQNAVARPRAAACPVALTVSALAASGSAGARSARPAESARSSSSRSKSSPVTTVAPSIRAATRAPRAGGTSPRHPTSPSLARSRRRSDPRRRTTPPPTRCWFGSAASRAARSLGSLGAATVVTALGLQPLDRPAPPLGLAEVVADLVEGDVADPAGRVVEARDPAPAHKGPRKRLLHTVGGDLSIPARNRERSHHRSETPRKRLIEVRWTRTRGAVIPRGVAVSHLIGNTLGRVARFGASPIHTGRSIWPSCLHRAQPSTVTGRWLQLPNSVSSSCASTVPTIRPNPSARASRSSNPPPGSSSRPWSSRPTRRWSPGPAWPAA